MKKFFCFRTVITLALTLTMLMGVSLTWADPWRFGVMSDTQWIGADDGRNPNSVPVDIIKALNQEFINHGVKFVVEVGDLVDQTGSTPVSVATAEDTRAAFAQELYNAGIGFFPFRGNHDAINLAGYEFKRIYPQTLTGAMNSTPPDVFTVSNPDAAVQPFPKVKGNPFVMGTNFSTPNPAMTGGNNWTGLSYSFDFNNARFVMLDQFTPLQANPSSTLSTNPWPNAIDLQQSWINTVLPGKPAGGHAFVFSHKGLITENHVDTLFGSDPSQDPAGQNAFITSLYNNGVHYYIHGHDHMYDRSLVSITTGTPTDGVSAKVENILCASDSSKFYTPGNPPPPVEPYYVSNDDIYDVPAFGHKRQAQIAQQLHTTGYYIFTVDGPRVNVDYYSAFPSDVAPNCADPNSPNCEWLISTTPTLSFVKGDTFGYSLNGHEFQVCQVGQLNCNSSYTQVVDNYNGTTAKILSGVNGSAARDFNDRHFIKTVDTGWAPAKADHLASNILTLWGMADLGTERTDVYTLSMGYNPNGVGNGQLKSGSFGLATKGDNGEWINAVDMNFTGNKGFVLGPWNPSYELGTYGVDPSTGTAWAVINYNSDFAVTRFENNQGQEHRGQD